MAEDIFGSLGGLSDLFGGIAKSVVPKDSPEGKLFNAQSELSDLQKQESELLLEIGRQAYEHDPTAWPQHSRLQLIAQNIQSVQATLNEAKQAQERAQAAKAEEDAKGRCTACGCKNPEGVKFCQDCGSPLAAPGPKHCGSCGAQLASGTRFCGECGARQD